jgi:hypothetical protein
MEYQVIKGGLKFTVTNVRDIEHIAEHNDCTVRALKVAAGVPYADAHAMMAKLGRRPRKGMSPTQVLDLCNQPHVYGYTVTPVDVHKGNSRVTLSTAMAYLRKGRYLIVKTGHALACIDGVLTDMGTCGPSSRVTFVLKFTPMSETESAQ